MARGKVTFNDDICKGCELCVSVCPKKIISLNKKIIKSKGIQSGIRNRSRTMYSLWKLCNYVS